MKTNILQFSFVFTQAKSKKSEGTGAGITSSIISNMEFLKRATQTFRSAIRGGEKEQKTEIDSQSVYFDSITLPDIVAERIATFLRGKDLINLGMTCKFWNEVSRKNFVWKILVETRFGKQPELEPKTSPLDYKKLYFKLATSKKPATACNVVWLNGDYLEKVKDKESEFGEVIQLNTVCWLQIDQFFLGVLPGKYSLVWRMQLDRVYVNGENSREAIEFRARPEEGCGKELCSKWTERDLQRAEKRHGSCKWYLQTMGEFEVTTTCRVYVEIKGRTSWWCGGMSWDYVELRPLN